MWLISNIFLAPTEEVLSILRAVDEPTFAVSHYIGGAVKPPGLLIINARPTQEGRSVVYDNGVPSEIIDDLQKHTQSPIVWYGHVTHARATDSEDATVWTPEGEYEYEYDNQSAREPKVEIVGTRAVGRLFWKKQVPVKRATYPPDRIFKRHNGHESVIEESSVLRLVLRYFDIELGSDNYFQPHLREFNWLQCQIIPPTKY